MMKWVNPDHLVHPIDPVLLPKLRKLRRLGKGNISTKENQMNYGKVFTEPEFSAWVNEY